MASSFLLAHPVDSIYLSVDSVNPGIKYGGIWVLWGQGRVPVGADPVDTNFDEAEKTGGAKTHTLTKEQMPSHTHIQNAHMHNTIYTQQSDSGGSSGQITMARASTNGNKSNLWTGSAIQFTTNSVTATNQNTGGDEAHNNLQPYIVCFMWKRTA